MIIHVQTRQQFSLDNYRAVAWRGARMSIDPHALITMDTRRETFLQLLNSGEHITVYGVTSGYGQMASVRLTEEQRRQHARQPPFASMVGFGGDLPKRIKRGIVFCRLTNFVEGHAAVSSSLAQQVSQLLDGPLPIVAAIGNTSAGEIIPLSQLFAPLWDSYELKEKEALALINGSPCASALMADIVLSTEARMTLCQEVFSLAAAAISAPAEHYSDALSTLYGDPSQSIILERLRTLMGCSDKSRPYQAPVSWRILPRVLGQLMRSHEILNDSTAIALQAVTDNPVYVPPDNDHPLGQVLSNGGYHNANACPMIDQISGSYADLALLADRQVSKLFDSNVSRLPPQLKAGDGYAGCLGFIAADYAEQARSHATRTGLLGSEGGGFGQNDVLQPVFHAWRKAEQSGRCLDATLAILAVTCSQAFYATDNIKCPPLLAKLLEEVRELVPPLTTPREMGFSVGKLAEKFTHRVYDDSIHA